MRWTLLKYFNKFIARLRGAIGWCGMAYKFNRQGIPEEEDSYGVWEAIEPRGIFRSWWGAFMFEYKGLEGDEL